MDGDGFEVLRGALGEGATTRYDEGAAAAREVLRVRGPGEEQPSLATQRAPGEAGVLDPYAVVPAARELLLAPPLVARLAELLGAAPLLIDASETAAGAPDDGPHRDATWTGLDDPDAPLAVAVVA